MWRPAETALLSTGLRGPFRVGIRGTLLLIRTRIGRLVKLLAVPREMPSFVGLYAVSRSEGSFAY
jgi:hypothetical protein